jgi:hypothetical protein
VSRCRLSTLVEETEDDRRDLRLDGFLARTSIDDLNSPWMPCCQIQVTLPDVLMEGSRLLIEAIECLAMVSASRESFRHREIKQQGQVRRDAFRGETVKGSKVSLVQSSGRALVRKG